MQPRARPSQLSAWKKTMFGRGMMVSGRRKKGCEFRSRLSYTDRPRVTQTDHEPPGGTAKALRLSEDVSFAKMQGGTIKALFALAGS